MPGRPSAAAAADKAQAWLAKTGGAPAEAARLFGLSPQQARRIARKLGMTPKPIGRPSRE